MATLVEGKHPGGFLVWEAMWLQGCPIGGGGGGYMSRVGLRSRGTDE